MKTLIAILFAVSLAGCGTMNAWNGAALNKVESDYSGAKQNLKSFDDMKFVTWADAACAIPLGALQRNATGNPRAVNAVFEACPVANVGVVTLTAGGMAVQVGTVPAPSAFSVTPPVQPKP